MSIVVTPEVPGPFLLPRRPGLADQGLCLQTKNLLQDYLFSGKEVGEELLMVTYDVVQPIMLGFKAMADAVANRAFDLRLTHKLEFDDPLFDDIHRMNDRVEFYMQLLEDVREESLEVQREEIYKFVVRPVFDGLSFKVFFDDETEVIKTGAYYCEPQRLAGRLGLSVNLYRELRGIFGNPLLFYGVYTDYLADFAEEALPHPEFFERKVDDAEAALEVAREAVVAALEILEDLGRVVRKGSSFLVPVAVATVALYLYKTKAKTA